MEKQKSIGGLWAYKAKNGTDYFSGKIELDGKVTQIVAFYNGNKKNPKEPDYRILLSTPKEQTSQENALPQRDDEEAPF